MRWAVSIFLLTSIYLLVLISLDPWDIAAGLILSTVLVFVFRSYVGLAKAQAGPGVVERARWIVPFTWRVFRDVTVSAFRVAVMVVHIRPIAKAHFIEIPFEDYTVAGVALTSLIVTLAPGSVLIDIDWDRRVMLMHVLDDAEPDEIRRTYRDFYEHYQRHVLP